MEDYNELFYLNTFRKSELELMTFLFARAYSKLEHHIRFKRKETGMENKTFAKTLKSLTEKGAISVIDKPRGRQFEYEVNPFGPMWEEYRTNFMKGKSLWK